MTRQGQQAIQKSSGAQIAATLPGLRRESKSVRPSFIVPSPAAMGNNSIASAIGINSRVKGAKGNWIVCAEWVDDAGWKVKTVKTVKVDGKRIKENTWYMVKDGKFVEVL